MLPRRMPHEPSSKSCPPNSASCPPKGGSREGQVTERWSSRALKPSFKDFVYLLDGKTWNHPIVADGRLIVRNGSEAASLDLAG